MPIKMELNRSFFKNSISIYSRAVKIFWEVSPKLFLIQFVLQILQSVFPVLVLIVIKQLFDTIVDKAESFETVFFWLAMMVIVQLIQVLVSQVSSYFSSIYQDKLSDSINVLIIKKSISIPYPYFEDPSYYDSLHLAQQQSIYKIPSLFQQFQATFSNALSLGLLVGYFFSLINIYAWIILLIAIPLALAKWYSGFALHRLEYKTVSKERESNYYHYILTGDSYAQEIRTMNFGESLLLKYKNIREFIFGEKRKLQKRLLGYMLLTEAAEIGVLFFILLDVARKAFYGSLGISLLVIYIQGIQRMQSNLKGFLNSFVQLIQQRIFLNDIFRFLDIVDHQTTDSQKIEFPEHDFSIKISDLSFSYPDSSSFALENVSMNLPKGKIIGIVGVNGSGKSTLIKILAGLYTVDSGKVLIGGNSIECLQDQSFRKNSLFLFQDFQHYFLTVEEVISLGEEEEPDHEQRILNALKKSQVDEIIAPYEDGLKTKMGKIFKDGKGLSGGQWQKLAIARAFYRNPKLLVLDEPTSALDAISETSIFDNLREGAENRVTVFITHRLYNLKQADYIYVLDKGKITQEGVFSNLILEKGLFREMYERQNFH
jgi:ATP-binding cassette subfamily B protein